MNRRALTGIIAVYLLAALAPRVGAETGLSLGVGYPYLSLKYDFRTIAMEGRFVTGSGIQAYSGRGYWNFHQSDSLKGFTGLEGGYIKFDTLDTKGTGSEAAVFAGGEYFFGENLSLMMDFAPTLITLKSGNTDINSFEYVANLGLYLHFGGPQSNNKVPKKAQIREVKNDNPEKLPPPLPEGKVNTAPQLLWTGGENYAAVGLSPGTGNTRTTFVYRVKYTDADNDAPAAGYPQLHISKSGVELAGSPFAMEYVSGGNKSGAVYEKEYILPAGNTYTYYFAAMDARRARATGAPGIPADGPIVAKFEADKMAGGINVAVSDFIGKNVSQADASIVGDFLRTALVSSGMFNVMDRNNMESVLAEQKFQNSGCTEQQCAVEMGKLLNVKQMLVGSLSKLLDTYYITVNVVDVSTGKITASYDEAAKNAMELKTACQTIVQKISAR